MLYPSTSLFGSFLYSCYYTVSLSIFFSSLSYSYVFFPPLFFNILSLFFSVSLRSRPPKKQEKQPKKIPLTINPPFSYIIYIFGSYPQIPADCLPIRRTYLRNSKLSILYSLILGGGTGVWGLRMV